MSTLTLIVILMVPMVILGVVAFALIIAYLNNVARVTAELEARKKQGETLSEHPAARDASPVEGEAAPAPDQSSPGTEPPGGQ